ncbi:uncharacterized protein V2V93DRAFT_372360 [Kockiozyma suomiensis]|uniref:uncharacterized protein n=1 Tax=Kockiozyma suomiensis TaxID=1337062 RepID=UPI003343669B
MGLVAVVFLGIWIPQTITIFQGDAIDSPPRSFPKRCRQDYRTLMYSEAMLSPPERLLPFAKKIISSILKEEGVIDVTAEGVLAVPLPDLENKDDKFRSGLAYLYTKCGDYLFALGEIEDAEHAYNIALKCSSLLNPHTAAACRGLSALLWSREDPDIPGAIKYAQAAVTAAGSLEFLLQHSEDLVSLDAAATFADEMLASKGLIISNREFLSAEIELGALYAKAGEKEKGLTTLLRALKTLYDTEEASIEGKNARNQAEQVFRATTGDEAKAKFYISEVLLSLKLEQEAYDWAQMAFEAAMPSHEINRDSAEIARMSMMIMARVSKNMGNIEDAKRCEAQVQKIPEPIIKPLICFGWRV